MGETLVRLKIRGAEGRSAEVKALASLSSTFSKILEDLAARLRLEVVDEVRVVEIGDRRIVDRKLVRAEVELEGISRTIYLTIRKEVE
jgi:hypothetical protein